MRNSLKKIFSVRKKKGKKGGFSDTSSSLPLQPESSKAFAAIHESASTSRTSSATGTKESAMADKNKESKSRDALLGSSGAAAAKGGDDKNQHPQTNLSVKTEETDEAPHLIKSYDEIPVLEQTKLPRGGVSVETSAVGRVQFGIPPETIKDSMRLGLPVPQVYIVPVERFCREMGPALGVNLAEFEFPAYFNFFVYKKRCTLVVDSTDAEDNIRRVFSETLLGPAQFRREVDPIPYEPEDFAPDFPRDAIPNFQKELKHFRIMPDGKELVIETLLDFRHFEMHSNGHQHLGVPPPLEGTVITASAVESEAIKQAALEIVGEEDEEPEAVPMDIRGVEHRETKNPWTYSQARFDGDVATVWPTTATEEQKKNRSVPRVEIFKMPGGTEYIIHDVDENNFIVGKARVSGHVKVSESMSVDGFGGHSILDDIDPPAPTSSSPELAQESESSHHVDELVPSPATFHPPSFGVTVLGNSHGFDKSGSVSGYVLWINGRGVMIDPPPYSSATLEREGIRPRTIVGIILTHCHADHDAGAFQKVLTGSPVVVITTPTIYKSFIRKYAALSALSPALLRHSHRYKQAIIGQPLRFQGATFHFTYTLHTIPCVGFRVEWRGRSMVFTGDHFNSPAGMDKLQESGVLSKARADDLRNLPLQETDLLLHEAGAPPIHTPLDVLLQLPKKVKKRLYVVHTSALPEDCELKAAPTGTKGTIRLDQVDPSSHSSVRSIYTSAIDKNHASSFSVGEDDYGMVGQNEYSEETDAQSRRISSVVRPTHMHSSFVGLEANSGPSSRHGRTSVFSSPQQGYIPPPQVALRPASSTDAWFILNLLSAVPFISSLSYTSTMELLETARVDAYRKDDVILPASRRSTLLCVVWEGTCAEAPSTRSSASSSLATVKESGKPSAIWHAGDWTGPISLQPDVDLSGESSTSRTHDVVAVSDEGVKVITVEFQSLHCILKGGSSLYRKYLVTKSNQERAKMDISSSEQHSTAEKLLDDALKDLNVLELLNCNSALRKLNAVQKRHLESLAEGPIIFKPGERLWKAGTTVEKAFIIVSGSASFVPKRRAAGSATASLPSDAGRSDDGNLGSEIHMDAKRAMKELSDDDSVSSLEQEDTRDSMPLNKLLIKSGSTDPNHIEKLKKGLERRANQVSLETSAATLSFDGSHDFESIDTENESNIDYTFSDDADPGSRSKRSSVIRRRSSHARKANKVLGRLYNRRAFTGGLVFSRGHFLGDVSKMVAGLLSSDLGTETEEESDDFPLYGFGDREEGTGEGGKETLTEQTIHEDEDNMHIIHTSTLTAGSDGCVVLVFPKSSIIPFLDQYPGLLLSLLGTQVVV